MLPEALYGCDISLKAAMLLGCNDAVMSSANLCALTYYIYNERFDLISFMISFKVKPFRLKKSFLEFNKFNVM